MADDINYFDDEIESENLEDEDFEIDEEIDMKKMKIK